MVTRLISNLRRGMRLSVLAVVAGVMSSGPAAAASCSEVPGWLSLLDTWCNVNGGKGPECNALPGDLQSCCGTVSPPAGEETCLCTAFGNLNKPSLNDLTTAAPNGAGVSFTCP